MGRFKVSPEESTIKQNQMPDIEGWPKEFNKPVIGIERDGILIEDSPLIKYPDQVIPIIDALVAVKEMRLKGYKVIIFTNQPGISTGKLTQQEAEATHTRVMQYLGQVGCYSIDSLFYAASNLPSDPFAMPNTGMLEKAERELSIDFSKGYFVGNKYANMKAGVKMKAKPIFIKTGKYESELKIIKSSKVISKDMLEFDSLIDFVNILD